MTTIEKLREQAARFRKAAAMRDPPSPYLIERAEQDEARADALAHAADKPKLTGGSTRAA